jgi:tetratricopeptide (TPR) repeat protein
MPRCLTSLSRLAVALVICLTPLIILGCSASENNSKAAKEAKKGPPLTPQALDHFRQAHKFLVEQKLEEAFKEFQETARLAPDSPLAVFWQGKAHLYRQERDQAEALFKKVLDMDPQNYHALAMLGRLYSLDRDKLDQAEAHLKQALDYSPENLEAHFDLGRVYARKGERDKALQQFRYLFAREAEFFIYHYELGRMLEAWGSKDAALREYRRTQLLNPAFDQAALAIKRLEAGEKATAVAGSKTAAPPPAPDRTTSAR